MKRGKGTHSSSTISVDGVTSLDISTGPDQLDPAVRDALIKRAEAEALQYRQDHEAIVTRTQEEEEGEAVKKLPAKKNPGSSSTDGTNGS
ncbi:hypothetical protein SEMRO_476_G150540.1 [Seminavis robusta]|uniref:Uncharacterized protein n=1 Tax=Seminavis robusta TaxID=568900 RepID=A0A9N8E319_9STRA|nr:hypothetical protein SEMRO_476_G150540.1 [Seminavis robusta]|eukprot:Sro476_g150540.1 n/a (90) ;mRNA; f:25793-26062